VKSSSGEHYVALDHVRALAAFMVVAWHFGHVSGPASDNTAPLIPFFDEGHLGVSLFMTLSGYLFAKLLSGRRLIFPLFLWNRAVRLGPLLLVALALEGLRQVAGGVELTDYLTQLAKGLILPTMPRGTWSIIVELHFYLLLPLLLWIGRRWLPGLFLVLAAAMALRATLWALDINLAHFIARTIVGRIDQFVLGILAFRYAHRITGKVAAAVAVVFYLGYVAFDLAGGGLRHVEALDALWIVFPSLEAASLAVLIVWYDRHPITWQWLSAQLARAGEYSYSIYLLHFLFFPAAARLVNAHVMDITNFYLALPWIVIFYIAMIGVGHLSFHHIERPFLRFRKPYVAPDPPPAAKFETQISKASPVPASVLPSTVAS